MKRDRAVICLCLFVLACFIFSSVACGPRQARPEPTQSMSKEAEDTMHDQFDKFLGEYIPERIRLEKAWYSAYWKATNSGESEAYDEAGAAELAFKELHADKDRYALLCEIEKSNNIRAQAQRRELEIVKNLYLENQIDPALMKEMVDLSNGIIQTFNTFRAVVDGREYTSNEVYDVLRNSDDLALRRAVWEASKEVGPLVVDDAVELAKMRNRAAVALGYENYQVMSLRLQEHDPEEIARIFDELDRKTEAPFRLMKKELDETLARRLGITPAEIRPWHYADPFFQDTPQASDVDMDTLYEGKDILEVATRYYTSFGMDPAPILAKSDLYERPGKEQHAYCITMDRDLPDIRVLANLKNNEKWMDTLLHELGHAFYDSYYPADIPWLLKEPAHIFTTEAVAQMFGAMTKNPYWLMDVLGVPRKKVEEIHRSIMMERNLQNLIFARWSLVMYHFEREFYRDPGQDLGSLWWSLVERYQHVPRPEGRDMPDWASKIHVVSYPVYYHNYILGRMFEAQLLMRFAAKADIDDPMKVTFWQSPELGRLLKEEVFQPGRFYHWTDLTERATGAPLSPDALVDSLAWGGTL